MPAKPRLVIDARMLGPVPHGFARYVAGLAAGLKRISEGSGLEYEPVFLIAPGATPRELAPFGTCEVGAKYLSPLEWLEIPRVLKRLGAQLYHSPTFASLKWAPCPWIVTVHDLNHLTYGGRTKKIYYERLLKPFIRKARALVTVSEFSRGELESWSGRRAEIVENVVDPAFAERVSDDSIRETLGRHGLTRGQYFFCLSNSKPHKNLPILVQGYSGSGAAWDLVLNQREGELAAAAGPGPGRLRLIGPPSDADARALIAGAGAVVFPSLYEGFGLPPVEAACMGVPVVVSRIPAHREALSDLEQGEALWVADPERPESWAKALGRASRGEVLGACIESRSRLLKRFSALQMGVRMDAIYKQALGI